MPTIDTPTAEGATNVILNQRSLDPPYHRASVGIQGDENAGKAIGFDVNGVLGAIPVGASSVEGPTGGDDTSAIQAAIDANPARPISLPAGVFRISSLVLRPGTTLRGAGIGSTTLKKVDGFNGAAAIGAPMLYAPTVANFSKLTISDLSIDGNRASQSGGTGDGNAMGIWLAGVSDWSLKNLHISNCWSDGIYITGGIPGDQSATEGERGTIDNVTVTDCRRNDMTLICGKHIKISNSEFRNAGLGVDGMAPKAGVCIEPDSAGQAVTDVRFSNCTFASNGTHGLLSAINFGSQLRYNIAIDSSCVFCDNGENGVWFSANTGMTVQGVTIGGRFDGNAQKGIKLNNITGAVIDGFSIQGGADALHFQNDCINCVVGTGTISGATCAIRILNATTINTVISDGCKILDGTVLNSGTSTRSSTDAGLASVLLNVLQDETDEKLWAFQSGSGLGASGTFRLRAINDAQSGGANALVITRTGTAIDKIAFPATTASSLPTNGAAVFAGGVGIDGFLNVGSAGLAQVGLMVNTDGSNEKNWAFQTGAGTGASGQMRLRAIDDAFGSGVNAMTITRTGTAIGTVAFAGNVEAADLGKGFVLKSPDGTRYRIQVANGGALSTTPA